MAEKSKILIIGGTGYIGKFIVEASAKSGHPTFVLVRESTVSDPAKAKLIDGFKSSGVTLLHGDVNDHVSLVKAIKQVDVVISAVGSLQILDQTKIIAAIKEVGHIKRFFPSEFGNDVDHVNAVEPAKTAFALKAQIRRAIEAEGIPYTYVPSNFFAGYFLPTLAQPGLSAPPRDKVTIPGDGNPKGILESDDMKGLGSYNGSLSECSNNINSEADFVSSPGKSRDAKHIAASKNTVFRTTEPNQLKAIVLILHKCIIFPSCIDLSVFNEEHDIGTYTIKAVDDPRTLNKILYIKPPKNTYSFNELVSLWEKKIGKTLERIYVPEHEVLKQIQESPIPFNVIFAISHSVFVKGDQTNFVIEPSFGVEASELYPDVKYTTVEEYLDQFV
ncbi:hypothetical protein RHGRI_016062 [Rhododendron griersonianum]|uniref:NmrA-like domain-containing protein n=1 Tax=Rhododendron griersonianum TaxID=479676 RepID=A0AAV6JT80_9ERIC|nr:hypothetical protein RHGRI_016062 [Rhododendron griersonianum]